MECITRFLEILVTQHFERDPNIHIFNQGSTGCYPVLFHAPLKASDENQVNSYLEALTGSK